MPGAPDIPTDAAFSRPVWRRVWDASWAPRFAFAAAAALILPMTWPWCLHWRGEFLDHMDSPFHAWKPEFMARRILAGGASPGSPAFRVERFAMLDADGAYRDPCTGRSLDPSAFPSPSSPWP